MSGSLQSGNTASMTLAGNNGAINNVAIGTYPPEGSRAVTTQYSWLVQTSYTEDLQSLVARGVESTIQGMFVDNSQCAAPVSIYIPGVMHNLIVPAFCQATMPLFFGTALAMQISIPAISYPNAGLPNALSQYTRVVLLNTPTAAAVWQTEQPVDGGKFYYSIAASTNMKAGPGRLSSVVVLAPIAVNTIQVFDFASGDNTSLSNTLLLIPVGAVVGTVYNLNAPFNRGLLITYNAGATGQVVAFYS